MNYFKMISLIGFIQPKPTQTNLQCLFEFLANYDNFTNKTNVCAKCLPTFSTTILGMELHRLCLWDRRLPPSGADRLCRLLPFAPESLNLKCIIYRYALHIVPIGSRAMGRARHTAADQSKLSTDTFKVRTRFEHSSQDNSKYSNPPYYSLCGLDLSIKCFNIYNLPPKGAIADQPYCFPGKYKKVTTFVRKYIISKLVVKKMQNLCFDLKQFIKKWHKNNVSFLLCPLRGQSQIKKLNIKIINTFKYFRQLYIFLYFFQKMVTFMGNLNNGISHVVVTRKNYRPYRSLGTYSPSFQKHKAPQFVRLFETGFVCPRRGQSQIHKKFTILTIKNLIRNLAFYVIFFLRKVLWKWVKKKT
jgi:hypothetical protein